MAKTFEQECAEGRFEFNPNRSFEERCEIVRRTAITEKMTYVVLFESITFKQ